MLSDRKKQIYLYFSEHRKVESLTYCKLLLICEMFFNFAVTFSSTTNYNT